MPINIARKKVKRITMRYNRLVSKLETEKAFFVVEYDTPIKAFLKKVHAYIAKNWKYSQDQITKLVLDLKLSDQNASSVNHKDRDDCASYICETIQNMKKN